MQFRKWLLTEIRRYTLSEKPDMFIAFRGDLWLFDSSHDLNKIIVDIIIKQFPEDKQKIQAEFCCKNCGHNENVGYNAAKNIAARAVSTSLLSSAKELIKVA